MSHPLIKQQAFVFQHSFSGTASGLLRMAGEIPAKPDREQPDAVYSPDAVCISMADRS